MHAATVSVAERRQAGIMADSRKSRIAAGLLPA